jgi:hypothetical protein
MGHPSSLDTPEVLERPKIARELVGDQLFFLLQVPGAVKVKQ